ncbi:MAG TPA: peptide chain release factor N(5)-glutamine methyltransferase [Candidatus Nanopelagicales bacterium]
MPSARELLRDAAQALRAAGVPSPEVDAELLLAHATARPRATLRLLDPQVPAEQAAAFEAMVAQRAGRLPLQHLTGRAPFRHLELSVGPGVFIPRPETELVIDLVLGHLEEARHGPDTPAAPGTLLVDLCTGSAALALALATEVPGSAVHAVELDAEAVGWARRNASEHAAPVAAAGSSLAIHHADATTAAEVGGPLAALRGLVDVVVSNPPYVPDAAIPREPEVRDHDPHVALFGGPDGLAVVRPLAEQAALLVRPGGLVLIEHADVQGEAAGGLGVPALLRAQPDPGERAAPAWRWVADHEDLAGRPRITAAVRAGGRMAP